VTTNIPFSFDAAAQTILTHTIPRVAECVGHEPEDWRAKANDDEELHEDRLAHMIWQRCADEIGALLLSEELNLHQWDEWRDRYVSTIPQNMRVLVVDPIDGSSEWNRAGWRHSPLTTAAMLLDVVGEGDGRFDVILRAAVVGSIWQECTWGLDGIGLTVAPWGVMPSVKYVEMATEKRSIEIGDAMLAVYAPTAKHLDIARPLFDAAPYVHNGGGIPYALRVVEGRSSRSYSASVEPFPSAAWEHIGPVMASFGGADIARLDGAPLDLNPFIKQTSVTAANTDLLQSIVAAIGSSASRDIHHVAPLVEIGNTL
jgi:hypothetical protein